MFDHKREAVYDVQPMRATTVNFTSFFLDEKVSFDRFQPFLFDFISRNNGSWAFKFFFNKLVNVFSL